MKKIDFDLSGARSIAIVGHVNPDGDCVGSVIGLYRYIKENYPELTVVPYLSSVPDYLAFLAENIPVSFSDGENEKFDLAIAADAACLERIGAGRIAFQNAAKTMVIDHHETNDGFGTENRIAAGLSSTSELLTDLFETEKISKETAACLYTGIIQDSGVFRYPSTTGKTLKAAAMLIEKGFPFNRIIEDSVTNQIFNEKRVLGHILDSMEFFDEEKLVYSEIDYETEQQYHVKPEQLGSVVSEINTVTEAKIALFCYQQEDGMWKGSLRSRDYMDVSRFALFYHGGGHKNAAGFSFTDSPKEVCTSIRKMIRDFQ